MNFFIYFASKVEPFLTFFQSNDPLAPCLYDSLTKLVESRVKKFVKKEAILESNNISPIDFNSEKNLMRNIEIEFPYCVKDSIRSAKKDGKLTEKAILDFRGDIRKIYVFFCKKFMDKSPLKFKLTKRISCFNPKIMITKDTRLERFRNLVDYCVDRKIVSARDADDVVDQFTEIIEKDSFPISLENFSFKNKDRLDDFWTKHFKPADNYRQLFSLTRKVLILSHRNAASERGFSINKEMLVPNLAEQSLVAQRIVYDEVFDQGGVINVEIPKALILSVRNSRQRYEQALKEKKNKLLMDEEEERQKVKALLEIKELKEKKSDI